MPHIYHRYPCEEDLYALFRHHASLIETNISTTIDLSCPLPLDRGNKSGANAARKAGITVGPSEDWQQYWHLLSSLLDERYDTRPVHTLDEILLLQSRFPDNIRLYTATLDGELLAGVVMYLSAPVAHCQYIGASPHGKDSKALTLLFDYLIQGEHAPRVTATLTSASPTRTTAATSTRDSCSRNPVWEAAASSITPSKSHYSWASKATYHAWR